MNHLEDNFGPWFWMTGKVAWITERVMPASLQLGGPSILEPNGSQLVPRIGVWEIGCLRCSSIRTTSKCSQWWKDRCCSIIDWRWSTHDTPTDREFHEDYFDSSIVNSSRSSQVMKALGSTSTTSVHKWSKTDANSVLRKISVSVNRWYLMTLTSIVFPFLSFPILFIHMSSYRSSWDHDDLFSVASFLSFYRALIFLILLFVLLHRYIYCFSALFH